MTGGYLYRLAPCPKCDVVSSFRPGEPVCWRCQAADVERAELLTAAVAFAVAVVIFWAVLP